VAAAWHSQSGHGMGSAQHTHHRCGEEVRWQRDVVTIVSNTDYEVFVYLRSAAGDR